MLYGSSFQEGLFALALVDGIPIDSRRLWARGGAAILNDGWFLNAFRIGGAPLGAAIATHLADVLEVELQQHGMEAMIAIQWQALRGVPALRKLTVDRDAIDTSALTPLLALLETTSELPSLVELQLGGERIAAFDAASAIRLSNAVASRGLRFSSTLPLKLSGALTDADAVLVATSVRSHLSCDASWRKLDSVLGTGWPATAHIEGEGTEQVVCVDSVKRNSSSGMLPLQASRHKATTLGEELHKAGCTPAQLTLTPPSLLVVGGIFLLHELLSTEGFSLSVLASEGFNLSQLIDAGASAKGLLDANFSVGALRESGVPEEELLQAASGGSLSSKPLAELWAEGVLTVALLSLHPEAHALLLKVGEAGLSLRSLSTRYELNWGNKGLNEDDCRVVSIIVDTAGPLTRLSRLLLEGNQLRDGITALADVANKRKLVNLEELVLSKNRIGGKGMVALANAIGNGAFTGLKKLDLANNRIGAAGAEALARAIGTGNLRKLQKLILSDNQIGDDGCLALAPAISTMQRGVEILLDRNEIGEKGIITCIKLGTNHHDPFESGQLHGMSVGKLSDEAINTLGLATA